MNKKKPVQNYLLFKNTWLRIQTTITFIKFGLTKMIVRNKKLSYYN